MSNITVESAQNYKDLAKTKETKQVEKVGQEFEAYFITSMLKDMDKTTHFGKRSYREETTMAIMYEKMGDYLAKKGVGIKEMLLKYTARSEDTKVLAKTGDNRD